MMMSWTNGRFVSTPHRAVNRHFEPRYSIPFFVSPDVDITVAPLTEFLQPGEAVRMQPIQKGPFMVDLYNQDMPYLRRAVPRPAEARG